ncbi:MAG TPA: TIGR04190 family B12-binding domain/radical SAM domain protein, partial [Steroidobacteraceae bacterium]|nr:TIGR04190 family B12-binding domain/radical SAM domain protein [Steroidobacteraceae bacterium]
LTIASYLKERGLEVRIVNLALKMFDRRFDVRRFLERTRARAIGIDLHWLPHAHGALEIASLVRTTHPDVPVIFGGLSASYFHDELARYPQVDYVLRGDSTEQPLYELLMALRDGGSVEQIPNLTYRCGGEIRTNPLAWVPATLDYADVRPELLIEMVLRHRDPTGAMPFRGWWRDPITMVLPLKGCAYECATCGSSRTSCSNLTQRTGPAFRSPDSLVANARSIARFSRAPIVIPGDVLQGGREHAEALVEGLGRSGISNEIMFEFFDLPPPDYVAKIDRCIKRWSFEISPESHDPAVRHALDGESNYTNDAFEAFLRTALATRCRRIDVFYMIGLPQQTRESVRATVEYCGRLLALGDRRLNCFVSPMGPFVDPGSRIFEHPERFGYRLFARTLEEHRQLLIQPSWEAILNYESRWMSRTELVDATYEAAERLNALKRIHGRISARRAAAVHARIEEARQLRARLASTAQASGAAEPDERLRGEINRFSMSTVCDKRELAWPARLFNFRISAILRATAAALRH